MKKIFTLLILTFFLLSCQQKKVCNLNPKLLKSNDSILSKVKKEGFFKQYLNQLKEPELDTYKQETYRFLTIGSFGDYETYRVNKNGNIYSITFKSFHKYFENPITYKQTEIDSLTKESKINISENDWTEIKENLDKLNFWQLPVNTNEHYLDGTAYIIEAYNLEKNYCTERNYHATSRICPKDSSLYKSIFEKIIKFTKK
jgi:hypothetical protein